MSSNERPRSSKRSNALSRLRQLHNKIEAENRKLMVRYDLDAFAFGSTSPHFDPPVAYLDPDTRFGGVDPRITHFSDTCRNMDDMSANSFFELHIFDKDYGFEIKESNSAMYRYRGVMGSGKSSLMSGMALVEPEKNRYYLIDDPSIYDKPELFSELIGTISNNNDKDLTSVLFLEEVDDYLHSKKDNPFLSRLLSLSSGVTAMRLKVVAVTNNENESEIDPALLRTGRLFASVGFGDLTPEQANTARTAIGLAPKEFTKDVSLANALNDTAQKHGTAKLTTNRSIGFGGQ